MEAECLQKTEISVKDNVYYRRESNMFTSVSVKWIHPQNQNFRHNVSY